LDQIETAASLYRAAISVLDEAGVVNLLAAAAKSNLAAALVDLGQFEEAEALASEARSWCISELGETHMGAIESARRQGLALLGLRRAEEAERILRDALRLVEDLNGFQRYRVARIQSTLGECLVHLGRFDEAEPLLLESVDVMVAEKGEEFRETRLCRQRVAALYEAWGRPGTNGP
jgi:tetratricopeptide (TPR) repeat protein